MNNLEVLQSFNLNPALQNYVLNDIPKEYNKFQQAIYVYAKLCSVLNYDSGFLASDHQGPLQKMHKNPNRLETISPQNTDIVCYEFNALCMKLLNKIGIETHYYDKNGQKEYGTHSDIYFIIPNINDKLPEGLMAGEKIVFQGYTDVTNFKVDGKVSVYSLDFRKKCNELDSYVANIVEVVKKQFELEKKQQNEEVYNSLKVQQLEEKYKQFATSQQISITDEEKVNIFLEQINKIDLGNLAYLKYGLKLFKNIQKDLTEPANATFSIIREKQAPELYKLIGIFTYQGENDLFYLKIDPPSDITQISQFNLQADFDNDKFDYLSDYFSASAVIPQIQSKFIDDLLKDINFSNLYRLQALNKNSSSDTKLPSQFVDYYEFVKDRQFYLGQLQQKNQIEKEVHSSQTNNLEEKEFIK